MKDKGVPSAVTVCGDSADLAEQLDGGTGEGFLLAADGATSTLLRAGILPQVIVSDLDGDFDDQVEANGRGSVVFVHAHGDNMDAVRRYVPRFRGDVVCTCQCAPVEGVFNFGGFTDGDRAACIASSLGASRIRLLGFDFENPSEKPGRAPEVKARKLVWARRILAMLADDGVLVEGL